jgi:hypothetical protein
VEPSGPLCTTSSISSRLPFPHKGYFIVSTMKNPLPSSSGCMKEDLVFPCSCSRGRQMIVGIQFRVCLVFSGSCHHVRLDFSHAISRDSLKMTRRENRNFCHSRSCFQRSNWMLLLNKGTLQSIFSSRACLRPACGSNYHTVISGTNNLLEGLLSASAIPQYW